MSNTLPEGVRKEIEESLKSTLVIDNPKGIPFAVDKIEKLISSLSHPSIGKSKEDWVKRYELLRRELNMPDAINKLSEEIAASQPRTEDGDRLLQGFVNAYEVLKYDINPELIHRTKKYLAGQSPQQSSSGVEEAELGLKVPMRALKYACDFFKVKSLPEFLDKPVAEEEKWLFNELSKAHQKGAEEYAAQLQLPGSRTDAVEFAKWLDDLKINADKHFNTPRHATTEQLYQEFKKDLVADKSNSDGVSVASHSSGFGNSMELFRYKLNEVKETICNQVYAAIHDNEYPMPDDLKELQNVIDALQSLLNKDQNVQVSDTTGMIRGRKPENKNKKQLKH